MHSESKLPQTAGINQTQHTSEKDVRQRLQEALRRFGYKQVDVSKETGIHHSTLSLWLQGKVKGNQARIKETVEEWLLNVYTARPQFAKSFDSRFCQVRQNTPDEEASENSRGRGEELIPVEVAVGDQRLCLLWNADERLLTPELFGKMLAEDHGLGPLAEAEVVGHLKRALEAHVRPGPGFDVGEEMLCVVVVNLVDSGVQFTDCFEWDLAQESNDPADVAKSLVFEHSLPPRFESLIAFEIHKQLYAYRRFLASLSTDDHFHRVKKPRGVKESSTAKPGENVRLEPVGPHNLFRPVESLGRWSPHVGLAAVAANSPLQP